jgi:hypothetical protein
MKRYLALLLFTLAPCAQAQPNGPSDAFLSLTVAFGNTSGPTLYWLKPDSSYVVLSSNSRVSGQAPTYTSGRTGTYVLRTSTVDTRWRDLLFDGGAIITLDFESGLAPNGALGFGAFTWYPRGTGEVLPNTSARALANIDHPAIAGFVVTGPKARWVLVRGIGPTLRNFGVTDALASPRLEISSSTGRLNIADERAANPGLAAGFNIIFALTGAFALPANSADRAVLVLLNPGAYTALTYPGGAFESGSTLTEVYVLPYGG